MHHNCSKKNLFSTLKGWVPPKWIEMVVNSYPLLLWVHVTNAKVVLLQQTVVVADVVNKKLPFGLPLQKKHSYVSVRVSVSTLMSNMCLIHSDRAAGTEINSLIPISGAGLPNSWVQSTVRNSFAHCESFYTHTHTHTHTWNQRETKKGTKRTPNNALHRCSTLDYLILVLPFTF